MFWGNDGKNMKTQLDKTNKIKNQSTHLVEGTISPKVGINSNRSCNIYEITIFESNTNHDSTKTRINEVFKKLRLIHLL